jgi:hypothetical protein
MTLGQRTHPPPPETPLTNGPGSEIAFWRRFVRHRTVLASCNKTFI